MCAEAWSPKIAKLRAVDPSITEYVVETPDPNNHFRAFLEISEGCEAQIDEANYEFVLNLLREFENFDQYWTLRDAFGGERIISGDEQLSPELLSPDCEEGIKTLASNFWQLTQRQFRQIPLETLALVLSHESLLISSEDLLYRFISDQIPINPDYFSILLFVRFECLSGASIAHFIPLSEDCFDLIDLNFWKVICRRLELPVGYNCENKRAKEVYRPLDGRQRPDGIISYISRGWEDTPGRMKLEVTMNSVDNDEDPEIAGAIIAHGGGFTSKDEPNQWVCWRLDYECLRPSHYAFCSDAKSWILEGSMDGVNWTEIDRRTDVEWDGSYSTRSFDVSESVESTFVRLTQTDKNVEGKDTLYFCHFDVFGTVWEQ
jgi:hypothetical protein